MSDPEPDAPGRPATGEEPSEGLFGRTWELELLISGGVVFTLLQLPPLLERGFIRLEASLMDWWREASFMGYVYLKGIVYTLIAAFLLHLSSRAYWIGLVGLEKVYPEGVRWENLKYGPISRRVYREMLPPLPAMIERVDRFCSSIFAPAFLIVLTCFASILLVGLSGVLAWGLSNLLGRERISDLFWIFMAVFALLLAAPSLLDKVLGPRMDPQSRGARGLARLLGGMYRLQLGNLYAAISLVLFSHPRRRATTVFYVVVLLGAMCYLSLSQMFRRNTLWNSDAPAAEREISPLFYEDQWPEEGNSRLAPSIQSDMVEDPYLKLFIPYLPRRHDEAFADHCPQPQAKVDCAARIHRVALDGKPVPGLTFHLYTHPKSGTRGFLAYIPIGRLARGPHLLRIEPLPRRPNPLRSRLGIRPSKPFFIRFWT